MDVRKYHAAIEAGFELNEQNKFDSYVEELFNGANTLCLDMIVAYCKYHYSVKYSFLVMMEALFFTNLRTAVAGLGANKMAELKQIQEAMEGAQRELLAFDTNKDLVKTLYKKIGSDKIELAPEDIAKKLKEGKTIEEILD